MKHLLGRRTFNGLLAGGASTAALASFGRFAEAAETVRLIWWGNPDRDQRTKEVVDLYMSENPDVTVVPENYAWGDYWQKLATQAAGRNLPDVIQMDYRYIFEYARRGQLAALDQFMGNALELQDFDQNQLDSGKVDGNLYGVSMGANSTTHVYKQASLDELGVELPDPTTWTNDDFVQMGNELKGKLPEGMFFSASMGQNEPRFEVWVRQRGKALYTEDGQLGYELADLVDFFEFWYRMQEEGLTPPADLQAQATGPMEQTMLVTGHALFDFIHSNQLVATQKLVPEEINITMVPNQPNGQPGQYLKPSMLLSMAETSPDKEAAAKLLNFFITNPGANDILQIERGVTGDASIRERLLGELSPTETKIIDYLNIVATSVGPLPPPPPKNAGELDRALRPAWESVAFGQADLEAAATEYYENAERILGRS
ncbi:MAG: ABC transporter substrate-binding protein [Pseudomonadota bacterium]